MYGGYFSRLLNSNPYSRKYFSSINQKYLKKKMFVQMKKKKNLVSNSDTLSNVSKFYIKRKNCFLNAERYFLYSLFNDWAMFSIFDCINFLFGNNCYKFFNSSA